MALEIRELIISGNVAGSVTFPEIGTPEAFTVEKIDEIMGYLSGMATTADGQPLFYLGFFGQLGLDIEPTNGDSRAIIHKNILGSVDKITIKLNFDTLTSHTYVNQFGVLEHFTLERLIIHEAVHALSGNSYNDDNVKSSNLIDLMSPNPEFQGDTVKLTNDILDEIHGESLP